MKVLRLRFVLGAAGLALLMGYAVAVGLTNSPLLDTPALAQVQGEVPGDALGTTSDSEFWRQIRQGVQGTVSIPDKRAGILVTSAGEDWRVTRNTWVTSIGAWLLLAVIVLLAAFFGARRRIGIDAGSAGKTVTRFKALERFTHWLTASSFVVLGLTGLNLLYGKHVLIPVIGQNAFAALTNWGKVAHNHIAFAFMLGLVMMAALWVRENLPDRYDLPWLSKGGGLFTKGVHPAARKFNAGQKLVFWSVILGGIVISLTGLNLLFPLQATPLILESVVQELQWMQLIHAGASLLLIALIIAHIYIGSLGMVGAIDAVWSGEVDENWAKEHHSVWVSQAEDAAPDASEHQPAQPAE